MDQKEDGLIFDPFGGLPLIGISAEIVAESIGPK